MKITLNGEIYVLSNAENPTILDLTEQLKIDVKKLAIEKNLEIIPKENFATTQLQEGDEIEMIHFIGGG